MRNKRDRDSFSSHLPQNQEAVERWISKGIKNFKISPEENELEALRLIKLALLTQQYYLEVERKTIKDTEALELSTQIPKEWLSEKEAKSALEARGVERSFFLERERELGYSDAETLSYAELAERAKDRAGERLRARTLEFVHAHSPFGFGGEPGDIMAILSEHLEDPEKWIQREWIKALMVEYPDAGYLYKSQADQKEMRSYLSSES